MKDTKPGKRCKKSEYRQQIQTKEKKVRNRKEKQKREKGK